MKDDNERRNTIIARLLVAVMVAAFVSLALIIKNCVPDSNMYNEEYDEYLEEKYDGAERYDPF